MPADESLSQEEDCHGTAASNSDDTALCSKVQGEVSDKVRNAATVKMKLNDQTTNVLLDSGALKSVIDHGSLTAVGMQEKIKNNNDDLLNASGDKMDIMGEVDIDVSFNGQVVVQRFSVLNTKTFSNILLGRDFLHRFGQVTFDFDNSRVFLGKTCLKTISVNNKNNVRMKEASSIRARTEQVTSVRCKKNLLLLTSTSNRVLFPACQVCS